MKITKKGGNILISELKTKEIFTFLKCQIPAKIVFSDNNGNIIDQEISLINRDFINNSYVIEIDINGKSQILSYGELLKIISNIMVNEYSPDIMITVNDFKEKEPLIMMIENIRDEITSSCIYIDYNNNTFEIKNKPFKNGDSDKMFYFELNDTLLAFSEDGPILMTDNPKINSIDDIIGNK